MKNSPLETDIFNYHTPEFFINMKKVPDKASSERKSFVLEEKKKCREGININGIYIPGGLYMHLNYYHLEGDDRDNPGKKKIMLPTLRDNEWIIFNDYDKCQKEGKIYPLYGGRQISKSETEVSLCLRELSLYTPTEAIALFANDFYRDTFVKKARTALTYGQKFIYIPNIDKDWNKSEIRFGLTRQDNSIDLRGTLYIYNTQEGKKIQVGSGKALKHGSKVYYEDRIGNIEDCKIGDKIYGRDGKLTTILGVYPQGIVDLYEIEFFDGRTVVCSGDHLWTVNRIDKTKNRTETLTTEKIFDTYKRKYFNKKLNKDVIVNRYTIPNILPVDFSKQDVLINPYYLGLWLGDGTTANPSCVTTVEEEIIAFLEKYSKELGGRLVNKDKITYSISNLVDKKHSPVKNLFKYYNLKGNKRIPKEYLFNSYEVRLELLKGLMDTDGFVDKQGHISISISDKLLSEDIVQLIRSLGINCTVTQKNTRYFNKKYGKIVEGKVANIIYIGTSDIELFKLSKKLKRQIFKKRAEIGIQNIKKVSPDYATCIKVDNSDSLFLTDNFVPTHNTASFLLFDEAAASPFKSVLDTMEPALLTDLGNLRCAPIIAFTGGETQKAEDAKNMVENPSPSKHFTTTLDDGRVIGGRFMDGRYRKDCKKPSTISKYLGIQTGTWLDDYPIMVTDFDYAINKIKEEREEAAKDPNRQTLVLKKIFFPLTLEDVFLSETNNKFPIEPIKQHQTWLKEKYEPIYADLYRDLNGKVQWKHSELRPLNKFPIRPSDNKEACVQIFELPVPDAPKFTYCIGIDPVNANESNDKIVSLYSIYVYKRMISPLDLFKDQVVCSISYRPKELSEAHELSVMIAEFYNAVGGVLPEASENSLFQYFFLKRKGHFLADSFDLITEINAKTKIGSGKKGLPVNAKYQRHYMGLLVEYANEEIIDVDEEGDEILKLGVAREYDYMLLEEYKEYKGKTVGNGVHDGNYDRVIARGCAQTLAEYYNAKYPITSKLPERKQQTASNLTSIRTMFGAFEKKTLSPFSKESSITSKLPSWMRK